MLTDLEAPVAWVSGVDDAGPVGPRLALVTLLRGLGQYSNWLAAGHAWSADGREADQAPEWERAANERAPVCENACTLTLQW